MTLTSRELESRLGVAPKTVYLWRKAGRLVPAGSTVSDKGRPALAFRVVCPKLLERLKGKA